MASAAEQTFIRAVSAAEGTRQVAKAAAFVTYGFVAANLAAYEAALLAADVAYTTAVNSAASTCGAIAVPKSAIGSGEAAISPVVTLGNMGQSGPIPSGSTSFASTC